MNMGEVDPLTPQIKAARRANTWVHVDGALVLFARAVSQRAPTDRIEAADGWTTDGHQTIPSAGSPASSAAA